MRSLFRANWRCLYPRAGGGGQHPEAHPTYLSHPLVYFQKRRSLLFYALASRRPLSPPPPPRPLTFELNIPSSPWTGIFYTSPNVVFVYSPCIPRGTRVHCLTSIILFSGGRGCFFDIPMGRIFSENFSTTTFLNHCWAGWAGKR